MPHAAVRFDVGTGATLLREGAAQNLTKRVWATYGLQRTQDTVGAESVSVSITVCTHQLSCKITTGDGWGTLAWLIT